MARSALALALCGVVLVLWPALARGASSVYVINAGSNDVSEYDVGADGALAHKARATIAAGVLPGAVAVSPDGKSVYVTNAGKDVGSGTISEYDVGAHGALAPKASATISAGTAPSAVAVTPDGRSVYVANYTRSGSVSEYDVGAGGVLAPKASATIAAGESPSGVVVNPDGRSVYVTNAGSGNVSQYDVGAGGALAHKASATVAAGVFPLAVAVSPDGKSVYVTNLGGRNVSQYDVGADGALVRKATPAIARGLRPTAVAVSPDGKSVYITNGTSNKVSQYDIGAGGTLAPKARATIAAGTGPGALAVSPDQGALRCVVPKLAGKTSAGAARALRRAHCTLGTRNRRHSAHVRRGRVIAQRPTPGSVLAAGAPVKITLSGGP